MTTHSFRKTMATLIDDEAHRRESGPISSATKVSMTQDRYMSRGRMHTKYLSYWTEP